MSDIINFWENRNDYRHLEPAELKRTVIGLYTEDFLINYNTWMECLKEANDLALKKTGSMFINAEKWWEDMGFDFFCETMIQSIKKTIDDTKTLENKDMMKIVEKMINDHIYFLIEKAPKEVVDGSAITDEVRKEAEEEKLKRSLLQVKISY